MIGLCWTKKKERPPKWVGGHKVRSEHDLFTPYAKKFYYRTPKGPVILPGWWLREVWSPRMLHYAILTGNLFYAEIHPHWRKKDD